MKTTPQGASRRFLTITGAVTMFGALVSSGAHAQFQADYGGTGNEFGRAVHANSLGGYMVAGEAPSLFPLGQTDAYVIVTNTGGPFPMFERTYNILNGSDFATDIQETVVNGSLGYIVTGYTKAVGHTDADMFLMALDQFGNPVWCRVYTATGISGNGNDESYHVEVVSGGYVICGRSNSNHLNHYDAVILRTDMNGTVLWGRAYDNGSSSNDNFYSCDVLANGDLVACGATAASDADVLVARLTSAGTATWQNRYGTAGVNQGSRSIRACSSTGANPNQLIVAGNNGGVSVATALLIDATTAALTAGRTYSIAGNSYQEAMGVVEGSDSKFIFTGLVLSPTSGFGSFDFYLQRVFPNLANEWTRLQGGQGGTGDDRGWAVDVALPFDGTCDPYSIIATGMMTVTGAGQQLHLTRTDQFGLTDPCLTRGVSSSASVMAWPPITMPAPTNWGFLLDNPTVTYSEYDRDFSHCDGPLFAIVPVEPEQSTLGSVSGDGHDNQASTDASSVTSGVKQGVDEAAAVAAYPNPVRRGGSFVLDYLAASTAKVEVTVSDMTGRVIHEESVEGGKMRLPINTDGWSAGSYLVKLTVDGASSTRRMVVTD